MRRRLRNVRLPDPVGDRWLRNVARRARRVGTWTPDPEEFLPTVFRARAGDYIVDLTTSPSPPGDLTVLLGIRVRRALDRLASELEEDGFSPHRKGTFRVTWDGPHRFTTGGHLHRAPGAKAGLYYFEFGWGNKMWSPHYVGFTTNLTKRILQHFPFVARTLVGRLPEGYLRVWTGTVDRLDSKSTRSPDTDALRIAEHLTIRQVDAAKPHSLVNQTFREPFKLANRLSVEHEYRTREGKEWLPKVGIRTHSPGWKKDEYSPELELRRP